MKSPLIVIVIIAVILSLLTLLPQESNRLKGLGFPEQSNPSPAPFYVTPDSVMVGLFSGQGGVDSPVTPVISVFRQKGLAPFTVLFNAYDSTSPNEVVKYEWDFTDSNQDYERYDTGRMAGHRFDKPGKYKVVLKATDGMGYSDSTSIEIEVVAAPSTAKTYYISSSGNDGNNGLSESNPWKTINKIVSESSGVPEGSKILFKRGDTFTHSGDWNINNLMRSPPHYITIGAYGTGDRPILNLGKINTNDADEGQGIVITDLTINGDIWNRPSYYSYTPPKGFHEPGIVMTLRNIYAEQITMWASTGSSLENVHIDNKKQEVGLGFAEPPGTIYLYINNVEVENADSHGVYIAYGGKHILVENSYFHHNGIYTETRDGFTAHGLLENLILRFCEGHDNGYYAGFDSAYFNNAEYMRDFIIEGNNIHHQRDYVFQLSSQQGLVIRNNIIHNNALGEAKTGVVNLLTPHNYGTPKDEDSDNVQIYNNVFYNNKGIVFNIEKDQVHSVYIKNNIVLDSHDQVLVDRDADDLFMSNNIYFGKLTGTQFTVNGKGYDIAGWLNLGKDKNSLHKDPLLSNPSTVNFNPKSNSPAIDAGAAIPKVYQDFTGKERPQGPDWDIGAYEVAVGQGPTVTVSPSSGTYTRQRIDAEKITITVTTTSPLKDLKFKNAYVNYILTQGTTKTYGKILFPTLWKVNPVPGGYKFEYPEGLFDRLVTPTGNIELIVGGIEDNNGKSPPVSRTYKAV